MKTFERWKKRIHRAPDIDSLVGCGPTFSGLPTELLILIIDYLSFSDLKSLSPLSRRLNSLTNVRVWHSASVHDGGRDTARHLRKSIDAACDSILRDRTRASYIRRLSVRVNAPQATQRQSTCDHIGKRVYDVLALLSNLKSIDLRGFNFGTQPLCSTLSSTTSFSFVLEEVCTSYRNHPLLLPFLASHPSITSCGVYLEGLFAPVNRFKIDVPVPRLEGSSSSLLPNLRHYTGHMEFVRPVIAGRQLDSVEVLNSFQWKSSSDYRQLFRDNVFGFDSGQINSIPLLLPLASVGFLKLDMDQEPLSTQLLNMVMNWCGIQPSSITYLHVFSHNWMYDLSMPLTTFPHFTNTIELQWTTDSDGFLSDDLGIVVVQGAADNWPSLRRIAFVGLRRSVEYSRTDPADNDPNPHSSLLADHHDNEWIIDDEGISLLGPQREVWTFRSKRKVESVE